MNIGGKQEQEGRQAGKSGGSNRSGSEGSGAADDPQFRNGILATFAARAACGCHGKQH